MIHYYRSGDQYDYFMREEDEWYYLGPYSQINRIEMIYLPEDLEEIEWKDIRVDEPDTEYVKTFKGVNPDDVDFCDRGHLHNRIACIDRNYSYTSMVDLLKDDENDFDRNKSRRTEAKLYRQGLIEMLIYKSNDFSNISRCTRRNIPFSAMRSFFNEMDLLISEIEEGGIYIDDHYGEVTLRYENGKTIQFQRSLETETRIDLHGHSKDFLKTSK